MPNQQFRFWARTTLRVLVSFSNSPAKYINVSPSLSLARRLVVPVPCRRSVFGPFVRTVLRRPNRHRCNGAPRLFRGGPKRHSSSNARDDVYFRGNRDLSVSKSIGRLNDSRSGLWRFVYPERPATQ